MKHYSTTKLLIIILFLSGLSLAQEERETRKVGEISGSLGPEVTFLEEAPVIDGLLDKGLESLPVRRFPLVSKRKLDPLIPTGFRMAYGVSFFYLYIEAEADHLYALDRAFWFGDGFRMLMAAAKPNNEPAEEYYELGCSAVNKPELEWSRRIFLAVNLNKMFVRAGPDIKFEYREGNGKISFELFLPWKDIVPFHPFLSEAIGFNLSLAKSMEPSGSEATAYYQIVEGDLYDFRKARRYARLTFQKPNVKGKPQVFLGFKEGHITGGDPVHATIAAVSPSSFDETIRVTLQRGNEETGEGSSEKLKYNPGLTRKDISIPTTALKPDNGYSLQWTSSANPSCSGAFPLVIMPEFEPGRLGKKLIDVQNKLSKSSLSTLQFQVDELAGQLKQLKKYETGNEEYLAADQLLKSMESMEQGIDPFEGRTGYIRKAYRSKRDNTLQPYMVYLPPQFDPHKKYPFFVFLHGAEETEKSLIGTDTLLPGEFILLGPFGRGTTNGFAIDQAQDDIAEAMDAVKEDYPIDDSNIILSGVSMGGYGVYRTFFETPHKFKAVAVFSGLPFLATIPYSEGKPTPNFLDEQNLTVFKNLPMFIYHGEKDQNAPFNLTRELAEKLKKTGARVEFITDPERGHGDLSEENWAKFSRWVENIIKPDRTPERR